MYNNFNSYGASSYGNASQGAQTSQAYQGTNAQYQGSQKQYQPVGFVQSFYSQQNAGQPNQGYAQASNQGYAQASNQGYAQASNQGYAQASNQGYAQATSPESFHKANYRGNQPGHVAFQRSESISPSQQQQPSFQSGYGLNNPQFASNQAQQLGFSNNQQPYASSQYGSVVQANQPYAQTNISPNSFHMANYRGNQPGHDALRSETPAQQSFQSQSDYGTQQGIPQSNQQQQGIQSNTGFNNMGIGQQFGYNSSY